MYMHNGMRFSIMESFYFYALCFHSFHTLFMNTQLRTAPWDWSIVHNILKFAIISRCLILLLINLYYSLQKKAILKSCPLLHSRPTPLLSLLTFSFCLIFFYSSEIITWSLFTHTHITFITWDTTLSSTASRFALFVHLCLHFKSLFWPR